MNMDYGVVIHNCLRLSPSSFLVQSSVLGYFVDMSEQPKSFFADLSDKHERLKKRIHNFRMPLGPFGRFVMSIIYFTVPILGGYYFLPVSVVVLPIYLW